LSKNEPRVLIKNKCTSFFRQAAIDTIFKVYNTARNYDKALFSIITVRDKNNVERGGQKFYRIFILHLPKHHRFNFHISRTKLKNLVTLFQIWRNSRFFP